MGEFQEKTTADQQQDGADASSSVSASKQLEQCPWYVCWFFLQQTAHDDFDEEDEDTNLMSPLGRKLFSAQSVGTVGPEAILQS